MLKQCSLTLITQLLFTCVAFSQVPGEDQNRSLGGKLSGDADLFFSDAIAFFAAPADFGSREWSLAAATGGTIITLMVADREFQRWVGRDTEKSLNDDFWDFPTSYGIVQYANLFSLGTYATGLLVDSDELRTTGRLLFESLSLSGASVITLRYLFGRSRPYGETRSWDFNWFEWSNKIQAFPSGHTTVAFAVSTVLAERIGGLWARIGLYGIAGLTGFARIYNNQHWLSDVVAGGLLGFVAGLHVVQREDQRRSGSVGQSSNIELSFNSRGVGIVWWLR